MSTKEKKKKKSKKKEKGKQIAQERKDKSQATSNSGCLFGIPPYCIYWDTTVYQHTEAKRNTLEVCYFQA